MSHAAARILDFRPQDFLPEDELVKSDGVPLDSSRQRKQINLAIDVLEQAMEEQGADDVYVGGNQFVYYSPEQARAIRREVEEEERRLRKAAEQRAEAAEAEVARLKKLPDQR